MLEYIIGSILVVPFIAIGTAYETFIARQIWTWAFNAPTVTFWQSFMFVLILSLITRHMSAKDTRNEQEVFYAAISYVFGTPTLILATAYVIHWIFM